MCNVRWIFVRYYFHIRNRVSICTMKDGFPYRHLKSNRTTRIHYLYRSVKAQTCDVNSCCICQRPIHLNRIAVPPLICSQLNTTVVLRGKRLLLDNMSHICHDTSRRILHWIKWKGNSIMSKYSRYEAVLIKQIDTKASQHISLEIRELDLIFQALFLNPRTPTLEIIEWIAQISINFYEHVKQQE